MAEEKGRNRIVLVGNGFDLAHGLKSSYGDFLLDYFVQMMLSIWDEESKTFSTSKVEKEYFRLSFNNSVMNAYSNWNKGIFDWLKNMGDLDSLLRDEKFSFPRMYVRGKVTAHLILEAKTELAHSFIMNKNWTDIESFYFEKLVEIYKSVNVSKKQERIEELNTFLEYLKKELCSYLRRAQSEFKFGQDVFHGVFAFNHELDNPHAHNKNRLDKKIAEITHSDFYETELKTVYYINFNYTDVLFDSTSINFELVHIHGTLDNEDSIVFGYGDEITSDFEGIIESNIDDYLKHFKTNYYGQNDNYFKIIQAMKVPFDVVVVGHSLGLSDRLLLNTILEHDNCNYIHLQWRDSKTNHFRKRLALSRHFNNKQKLRERLFPILDELKI